MANFIVIYDACVLYPAPLRDLLMRLALTDLYHANLQFVTHLAQGRRTEIITTLA